MVGTNEGVVKCRALRTKPARFVRDELLRMKRGGREATLGQPEGEVKTKVIMPIALDGDVIVTSEHEAILQHKAGFVNHGEKCRNRIEQAIKENELTQYESHAQRYTAYEHHQANRKAEVASSSKDVIVQLVKD